ncbi:MAG: YigZ family protein [Anaerorhabdus sp.]
MRIKHDTQHSIIIGKSEFICYLHRCTTEDEARAFIAQIKKKHYDATHCCTAFVCGDQDMIQRCSDDGEPSGTAGIPMLNALKQNQIHDCCACVVRYFGGIKLGGGGLIRAYTKSVSECLHQTPKTQLIPMDIYTFSFPYDWVNQLDYGLANLGTVLNKHYEIEVTYILQTNHPDFLKNFTELTQGKIIPIFLEHRLVEEDIPHHN